MNSSGSRARDMPKQLVLILGGARAGKSTFAQNLAQKSGRVLFVATAEALDDDMAERIAVHRSQRPAGWETLEEPVDILASLGPMLNNYDTVLVDCLTLWVSNLMLRREDKQQRESDILAMARQLLELYESGQPTWIMVSNEVGWGVVPPTTQGRAFRDTLGRVNQLVAARADRVYLMVAGMALELKGLAARSAGQSGQGTPT